MEVWSRSLSSWLPGEVLEVDDDEINVTYTDGAQKGTKWVDAHDPASVRKPERTAEEALAALKGVREAAAAKAKERRAAEEKEWADGLAQQKARSAKKTAPKVGSKGSCFSRSAGQWLACVVVAVGGDEARVKYKLQGQVGEKYVYWADVEEFKPSGSTAASVVTTTIELTKGSAGYGPITATVCACCFRTF